MKSLRLIPLATTLLCAPVLHADLVNGFATIDYDKSVWDTLGAGYGLGPNLLTLSEFFDQAQSNARTQTQLQADDLPGTASYLGQVYAMNGSTVNNLATRFTQPTSFVHTPGHAASHTGSIGLGGVARFGTPLGGLLFGDFSVSYDSARITSGGSGWFITGNIPPVAAVYDLLNVTVVDNGTLFSLSGDLGVSPEVAFGLFSTPTDALRDVGNFSFTANVVPEPASGTLLAFATLLLAGLRRRK